MDHTDDVSSENRVGHLLLETGFITTEQLNHAAQVAQETDSGLLDTLLSLKIVAPEVLLTLLSFELKVPVLDLKNVEVDPEAVKLVPLEFARQHRVLPIKIDGDGSLRIAVSMPSHLQLSAQLSSVTGLNTKPTMALTGNLGELIEMVYLYASQSEDALVIFERQSPLADDELYEGAVRLRVEANGSIRRLVQFVRGLHENPHLRLLRLGSQTQGDAEILLGLRVPMHLKKVLGGMELVAQVSQEERVPEWRVTQGYGDILGEHASVLTVRLS